MLKAKLGSSSFDDVLISQNISKKVKNFKNYKLTFNQKYKTSKTDFELFWRFQFAKQYLPKKSPGRSVSQLT